MKKILLPLLLFPLAALAQNPLPSQLHTGMAKSFPYVKENMSNFPKEPVQAGIPVDNNHGTSLPLAAYKPSALTIIGNTTYDLQTNGALAKRVQLYSGGELSAVWIKSNNVSPDYATRYTGYNHYNGTGWIGQNTSSYEYDRNGWPNIGAVTDGSSTFELMCSHYAASGVANYAGGIFWYANTGIGKTDFTQVIDLSHDRGLTKGLLWPRMATSNNIVYLIGTYQNSAGSIVQKGVKNPIVYYRYNMTTKKFTASNITLPGYDSTRYLWGAADEYSLDARGKYVAVLIGGMTNDLALWKSSDSGYNWTKTVVRSFKYAPYDYKIDPMFNDTIPSNDGSGTVTLDDNGTAHVTFSCTYVTNATSGDSGVSFFGNVSDSAITYWNDVDKKDVGVGYPIDFDHSGKVDLTSANLSSSSAGYSGHNFASYSNTAVDAQGNIFVVYSCPEETDIDLNTWAYRHVYVAAYEAAKQKWHAPQDIVQTWQIENAFPTVASVADSKLHVVFFQTVNPGLFIPSSNGGSPQYDTVKYTAISTTDILEDKVGTINLGINDNAVNTTYSVGSVFPNPANNKLNISLNMKHSSNVTVKMYSVLGQEMISHNYSMLPSGANMLNMDLNTLPTGVYMCNITAGGYTTSQRIVIER
jgi:hypothetical protein